MSGPLPPSSPLAPSSPARPTRVAPPSGPDRPAGPTRSRRAAAPWPTRFVVALVVAAVVASATGLLAWLVRSDAPVAEAPTGRAVTAGPWEVTSRGVRTVQQLTGADGTPVLPSPGTVIVLVGYEVTAADPRVLAETICDVTLVSADGRSRWATDGTAVYLAHGEDRARTCWWDADAGVPPPGTRFDVLTSAEVPASRVEGLTAELSLFHNTDAGGRLRVHGDELRLRVR